MTQHNVKSILFDYGGVFTCGSRAAYVSKKLASNHEDATALGNFFRSNFVRQCARGEHKTESLINEIRKVIPRLSPIEIQEALAESCIADKNMLGLVRNLKAHYRIYLLSDSLPPYSDFISSQYSDYFDGLFMSDAFGARKSEGLYQEAEKQIPDLYKASIYIDDRKKNLISLSEKEGTTGIAFESYQQCLIELKSLGLEFFAEFENKHDGTITR